MGEKDLTEKILEDYNDVFADIFNGLVFQGEQRIAPEDLCSSEIFSQYKADDGKLHELERDVVKHWRPGKIEFAVIGLENQTKVANFFVNKRKNAEYRPDDQTEIRHVDEFLKCYQP